MTVLICFWQKRHLIVIGSLPNCLLYSCQVNSSEQCGVVGSAGIAKLGKNTCKSSSYFFLLLEMIVFSSFEIINKNIRT